MSAYHDARTAALPRDESGDGGDGVHRGRGDAAARLPAHDWSKTALGRMDAWPDALRAMADVCAGAGLPMALFWGEDGAAIYNDAFAALLGGGVTPAAMTPGRPAREMVDADVDDARASVRETRRPVTLKNRRLDGAAALARAASREGSAPAEQRHFDLTLTPFGTEGGGAAGVLCAAVETTRCVVGERRLRVLRELSEGAARASTPREACASVSRTLASEGAAADVSFSRLYVFEPGASRGKLAAASGVATVPCGEEVSLGAAGARSPLAQAAQSRRVEVLGGGLALALPLLDGDRAFALLVLGIGAGYALDADERTFFDLVAAQVGVALRSAGALAAPEVPAHDAGMDARVAIADARRQVEEANRTRDEFLATVSHELRTPLTSILGWARLLKTRAVDAATLEKGIATIERNARTEAQLIEDILDVSRLATGQLRIVRTPFDLGDVVDAALETLRPAAAARDIGLHVRLSPDAMGVLGDARRVQQVVWNLVSNAVKFTPRGGSVEVRAERDGDDVVLAVVDDGEGIPPEFLPHVFERFRQEDASTTRTHAGLGLGLAVVRSVVELHGGSVSAASAGKGLGARFVVRLPAPPVAEAQVFIPSSSSSSFRISAPTASDALRGLRVLVVDDEPDARDFLTMILSDRGADPRGAATVREALEALGPFHPDVLVSDIGMPDEDGYDLIRRIRAGTGEMRGVPALAVTAYAGAEDRRRAIGAGYQMYLAKPFEPDELIGAVSHLAGRTPAPLHS
jgi:signal transduction histidine kinase/ActR/RegA family two-component response regulator